MPDATTSRAPKRTAAGSKNPAERKSGGIQSIRRACALLETVARSPDGIGLADLSRALGLHTSTTFHIAKTLLDSAVATLPPANFQAGRMYTVISTGRGASFQMLQFADRQPGLTKPCARDPGGEAGTPRKDR